MRMALKIGFVAVLLCGSFIGGREYQKNSEDEVIHDIEMAAMEVCEMKVADIKKACK